MLHQFVGQLAGFIFFTHAVVEVDAGPSRVIKTGFVHWQFIGNNIQYFLGAGGISLGQEAVGQTVEGTAIDKGISPGFGVQVYIFVHIGKPDFFQVPVHGVHIDSTQVVTVVGGEDGYQFVGQSVQLQVIFGPEVIGIVEIAATEINGAFLVVVG